MLLVSFVRVGAVAQAQETAHAQASREYDLKAVFLYNLATFVEWPPSAFTTPESPFVIGVVGADPFGHVLDEIVADEFVGNRRYEVRRLRRYDDLSGCHVLFISDSESRRVRDIIRRLRGHPTLTVADLPGFVENGGMIGFTIQDNQLQLFVNPEAARAEQLSVSSKLLELAQIVRIAALGP